MNTKEVLIMIFIPHGKTMGMGYTQITVDMDSDEFPEKLKNSSLITFYIHDIEYKKTKQGNFVIFKGKIKELDCVAEMIYTISAEHYRSICTTFYSEKPIEYKTTPQKCIFTIKQVLDNYDPFIQMKFPD